MFTIDKKIAKGGFSKVYSGFSDFSNYPVAIKKIKIYDSSDYMNSLNNEERAYTYLKHENIIKCLKIYRSNQYCFFIFEYSAIGDLFEYSEKYIMSEKKIRPLMYDVSKALQYCHQIGIIHRDVKPENILIFEQNLSNNQFINSKRIYAKLTDFGNCIFKHNQYFPEWKGTKIYVPPEMISPNTFKIVNVHQYLPSIDIWAFGIVIYEILAGKTPFKNSYRYIKKSKIRFPDYFSKNLIKLLKGCLKKNYENRWSWDKIINSHWFSDS